MKLMRYIYAFCAILYCQSILSSTCDSVNLRLAYDDPVTIYKNPFNKIDAITIESDTETDEYFYITVFKNIFGNAFIKGVSDRQIVYGWIDLKKEQLYVTLKDTKDTNIKLYRKPYENNRYFVKVGEFGLFPVVNININTGWVLIRYTDGKCYWVSPKVQCPWYTECYGT